MDLPHDRFHRVLPGFVLAAEPAVFVAIRIALSILVPKGVKAHVGIAASELFANIGKIRQRPLWLLAGLYPVDPFLKLAIREPFGQWPPQILPGAPREARSYRTRRDAASYCYLAMIEMQTESQSQDFFDSAHW